MKQTDVPSAKRLLLFYLPLVVLTFSQQLTYPLVSSFVSHGPLGEQEFTAYAVGQQVLFLIGAIGAGLITTSMMFCRTRTGLRNYLRMNYGLAALSPKTARLKRAVGTRPWRVHFFGRFVEASPPGPMDIGICVIDAQWTFVSLTKTPNEHH